MKVVVNILVNTQMVLTISVVTIVGITGRREQKCGGKKCTDVHIIICLLYMCALTLITDQCTYIPHPSVTILNLLWCKCN